MPNAAIWFEMFNILISKALNYPVDLYYLMDLSNSMSDDRENVVKVCTNWEEVEVRADQPENGLIWILIKLVQLGGELAKAIEAITPDYQIGWVGCSCCPFAHSMKWPGQPLQLVLWPPMTQVFLWSDLTTPVSIVTSLPSQIWQLCWQGSDALYLVGPGQSSSSTTLSSQKQKLYEAIYHFPSIYIIFRRTTARKKTARCLTGEALYSGKRRMTSSSPELNCFWKQMNIHYARI